MWARPTVSTCRGRPDDGEQAEAADNGGDGPAAIASLREMA